MTQLFIGINLLQTPNDKQLRQASQLSSKQNDPLNYSSFHISLVTSLDLLYRSTVGSWHSVHFSGTTSPIEMLQNLLNWQPSFLPANSLRCWCSTAMFSQSINRRIEQLIQQLIAHYHSSGKAGRFLLAVANTLYSLQWQQGYPVEYIALPYHSIWQILAENGPFRQQQVDKQLDKSGLIARLLMMHRPGQLNLVLLDNSPGQICYVIDEAGRLFRQDYPSLSQSQLIARLQPFIQQLPKKHIATHFYHLSQQHERWFIRQLIPPEASRQYLPVQVRLDSLSDAAYVDIQYGQQRFVGHLNDSALTNRIQQLNQQLRQRQPTIVITINSLLFTNMAEASTGLYLQSKYQLEKLLQLLI